jgi:hypothetical protein
MSNASIKFTLIWSSFIYVVLISSVLALSSAASDQNSTIAPLFMKKKALSQSLDSLDLLKQNKKREGHSFSEIELKQKQILDTLQLIRKMIQTDITTTSRISDNKILSFLKSLSLSDWLIFITAIVLLFAGILLLFGAVKKALFGGSKEIISKKSLNLGTLPLHSPNSSLSDEFSETNGSKKTPEMNNDQTHFENSENNPVQPDNKNEKIWKPTL